VIVLFQKKGGGFLDPLIRWWTRGPYFHCELLWGDGTTFSSHLADKGTRFIHATWIPDDTWDAYWVPTSREVAQEILGLCKSELGCPYDWLGILMAQILGISRQSSSKWFCSEVCYWALMSFDLLPKRRPHFVNPNKFAKILNGLGVRKLAVETAIACENYGSPVST
jgi:hypothetical protein